jgi:hypothetical protein
MQGGEVDLCRCAGQRRVRVHRQRQRWPCRLVEVEVAREVAEDRDVLTDGRSRIVPTIGRGIEALASEEVVFDELQVRVEAQRLIVGESHLAYGLITNPSTRSP